LSGHIASPNLQPSAIVGATVPLPMPKSPENLRLQVGREIIVQGNHWGGPALEGRAPLVVLLRPRRVVAAYGHLRLYIVSA
jgi:hypothetical protein